MTVIRKKLQEKHSTNNSKFLHSHTLPFSFTLISYNKIFSGKFKHKQHKNICFKWTKWVRLASKLIRSRRLCKEIKTLPNTGLCFSSLSSL